MRTRCVAALIGLLLAAGCSTLPVSGDVHTQPNNAAAIAQVPDFAPPGPTVGASREAIVRGFLLAAQANPASTSVARSFLSARARSAWKPVGTLVYDYSSVETTATGIVARLTGTHQLDERGSWLPAAAARTTALGFNLVVEDGEWRIDNPPRALPVPTSYFQSLYQPFLLYFFDRTGSVLVPRRVYEPRGAQVATRLVRALLAGPAGVGADSLTTAFSRGIDLDLSVVLGSDGVAEIPLSTQVQRLAPGDLFRAVSQLAATLRAVPGLVKIKITVDGVALPLGNGQTVVGLDTARNLDPVSGPGSEIVAYLRGRVVRDDDGLTRPVGGPFGEPGFALRSVAESVSKNLVAAIARNGRQAYLAPSSGSARPSRVQTVVAGGTDLLRPAFDRYGGLWLVDAGRTGAVVHLVVDGRARLVTVPGVSGKRVTAFTVTRDGNELVAGLSGATNAVIAVSPLVRSDTGDLLRAEPGVHFTLASADLAPIVDLGQDSASTVAVLVQASALSGRIFSVELDGSPGQVQTAVTDPVPGRLAGLLASPQGTLPLRVLTRDNDLLTRTTSGDWRRTASGVLAAGYLQ